MGDNQQETTSDRTGDSPFRGHADTAELNLAERPYTIYRCQSCENVTLTLYDCEDGMTCHGETMTEVTDLEMNVEPPALRDVMQEAFGLPRVGIDICLCVIDEGPLSPEGVADVLGYDESTVRRYLNTLTEVGLLTKTQLNREDGGFVNVYRSIDIEEMRDESLVAFYAWAGEAATLIEAANLTKQDYLDAEYEESIDEVFWEGFQNKREGGPSGE